jgi:hypothetical protein
MSWWCGMRYCPSDEYIARYPLKYINPLEASFSEHSAVLVNFF